MLWDDVHHGIDYNRLASWSAQGTNAHAVMANLATGGHATAEHGHATPWLRHRIWYEPTPHQLLVSATVYRTPDTAVVFRTPLNLGSLAFLRDHHTRGRILLPGAAMFEMASAAASTATLVSNTCH